MSESMDFDPVSGRDFFLVAGILDVAMVWESDHDTHGVVFGGEMLSEFGQQLPGSFRVRPVRTVKERDVRQGEILVVKRVCGESINE